MDESSDTASVALPTYNHEDAVPTYQAHMGSPHLTITLDPTATIISTLPLSSHAPLLYTLNNSLLHVSSTTSIHLVRPSPSPSSASHSTTKPTSSTEPQHLYALGEHFLSSLLPHPRPKLFENISAARSHGMLVTLGGREKIWDFSTRAPLPAGSPFASNMAYPTDPVYSIGTSPGPGTEKKSLLTMRKGQWFRYYGNGDGLPEEVVALEREAGAESGAGGMPVLSLTKDLEGEWMDFLVACWCVSLWGTLSGRVRRASHHSRKEEGKN